MIKANDIASGIGEASFPPKPTLIHGAMNKLDSPGLEQRDLLIQGCTLEVHE